jgi:hypothetical protein
MQLTSGAAMTQSTGHVAEVRDLLLDARGDSGLLHAADEDLGLDAEAEQLLHRVLRGLGLELARGAMKGTSVTCTEIAFCGPFLELELAHGLEERQRLDVADGAADLDDGDVGATLWPRARAL